MELRASLAGSSSGWWNQSRMAQLVLRNRVQVAVMDSVYLLSIIYMDGASEGRGHTAARR